MKDIKDVEDLTASLLNTPGAVQAWKTQKDFSFVLLDLAHDH